MEVEEGRELAAGHRTIGDRRRWTLAGDGERAIRRSRLRGGPRVHDHGGVENGRLLAGSQEKLDGSRKNLGGGADEQEEGERSR